jgi:hypothetical protein
VVFCLLAELTGRIYGKQAKESFCKGLPSYLGSFGIRWSYFLQRGKNFIAGMIVATLNCLTFIRDNILTLQKTPKS